MIDVSGLTLDRPRPRPVVLDLFAGFGGTSTGCRRAFGVSPNAALNHTPVAIRMHLANHPDTRHYLQDIYDADPREVAGGDEVDLLCASPNCTHFSKARNGKPKDRKNRALAEVVLEWVRVLRPRVFVLENVMEYLGWGPLDDHGKVIQERKGEFFEAWVRSLRDLGYVVDWKKMRASDFGVPTSRTRLFVVARRDEVAVVWPRITHGPGQAQPWRTAAECIDFSIPCPSIFLTPAEVRARKLRVKRPLAAKTLARIVEGLNRYVLNENAKPFLLPSAEEEPLDMVRAGGSLALVAPLLIQTGYGEAPGQTPRALDLHKPLGTVVAGGGRHALSVAHLMPHYGRSVGAAVDAPAPTVTAGGGGHLALIETQLVEAVWLDSLYGSAQAGVSVNEPLRTISTGGGRGGGHAALVAALLQPGVTNPELVTVRILGVLYTVVDIGFRMLTPRELARANGFDDDTQLLGTKSQQILCIGNSVCPQVIEAIASVNLPEFALSRRWSA